MLVFQNMTQIVKTSYSFNNSKWRKVALSYGKKTISIVKRNNKKIMVIFII